MATQTPETVAVDDQPTNGAPSPTAEARLARALAELESANRKLSEQAEDRGRLRASRERVKRLEARMLEAKEEAGLAKKSFEAAMGEHLALEDELDSGQARLPFPGEADGDAPPEDDWRSARLDTLTDADGDPLSPTILAALAEHEPSLETLGAVADWTRGGRLLTDVKGIGEGRAAVVEEVLEHFWNQRAADDPVNAEVLAGVREAEGPGGWRHTVVGDLGLAEGTIALLDEHAIATVGELVALARLGLAWMGDEAMVDVEDALTRFRHRLSNARIDDFDAARDGEGERA